MMNGAQIIDRLTQLIPLRQRHDNVWRSCYDLTFPLRADGLGALRDAMSVLQKQAEMLDDTAPESAKVLAANVMSGSTPSNVRWFGQQVIGETDEDKRWLDMSSTIIWREIHASNYDSVGYECALDVVAAGWFVLYVDEDRERQSYNFEQWHISQCYCAASKPGGKIDTIFREYSITAEQAANYFGFDSVSEKVQKLAKDKPSEMVVFVHAIYPRPMWVKDARMAKNLPFASCHVEKDAKRLVKEGGYHEFPCMVPRWHKLPNSVYGVGPVYDVLPTVRELNYLLWLYRSQGEIEIAPPLIARDDGVLNPRTIKIGAKKIIVASDVDSIKPLNAGGNWQLAIDMIDRLQASIRKHLMADALQPQDGPAMTATEVNARIGLIRQLLGPMYGRFQSEYLQPLVERCFGIAYRAGWLGEAPQSLQGKSFTVKFLSPMARAQMAEEVGAIQQFISVVMETAQVKPEALDSLDVDEAMAHVARGLGVPAAVNITGEQLDEYRQQKQQAQAQIEQQQADQQQQGMAMQAAAQKFARAK